MILSHPTPVLVPVPSIPPGTAARAVAAVLEQSWWVLTYLLQERGNKGDG